MTIRFNAHVTDFRQMAFMAVYKIKTTSLTFHFLLLSAVLALNTYAIYCIGYDLAQRGIQRIIVSSTRSF